MSQATAPTTTSWRGGGGNNNASDSKTPGSSWRGSSDRPSWNRDDASKTPSDAAGRPRREPEKMNSRAAGLEAMGGDVSVIWS